MEVMGDSIITHHLIKLISDQRHENYHPSPNNNTMTRTNTLLLAAVGGAVLSALIANYLMSEKGRQFLDSASHTLRDLSEKATEYAKSNLGEIVRETTHSLGPVVKEKIAQQVQKKASPQTAEPQ